MRKRILVTLCTIFLLLIYTGCSEQDFSDSTDFRKRDDGEVQVSTEISDNADISDTTDNSDTQGDSEAERENTNAGSEAEAVPDRPMLELGSMYIREADDENNVVYISGSHDTLRLSGKSAQEYPELSAALDRYMSSETKKTKKLIKEYVGYYKEDSMASEMAPLGYDLTDNLYVRRADRHVLSLLEYSHDYVGGAHGNFAYSSLNFDVATGKEISLNDVFTDLDQLAELLQTELLKEYSEDTFFDDMPETIDKEVKETKEKLLTWTLDPQGVTFYFDPYEIAPYAAGAHIVTILYSSSEKLFTDRYRPEEGEGYTCGLPLNTDTAMDVDQDGELDHVSVSYSVEEESDSIQDLTVSINNKHLSIDEIYCYSVEPIAVMTAAGRAFLYVWCRGDNDFVNMYIFDLSLGSPVSMGSMALAEVYTYIEEENVDYSAYKLLITDPQNMRLSSRCDLLSTYDIQKNFHLQGNNPVPMSEEPYYAIVRDITLTSVKDITADMVDEEGNVVENAQTIPSGSTFQLYRTDGENIVDAKLSDGRIARLLVTGTYPQYINGLDVNDLFEALFYAG